MSIALPLAYPERRGERNRWILQHRSPRNVLDTQKPYACMVEQERSATGAMVPVATLFLTNRECPWRCLMCDLWRNTTVETVPAGAIPAQITHALAALPPARQIKLYNSGSFFDSQAILPSEYATIAQQVRGFEHVIVESHPSLIGDRTWQFRDLLDPDQTLEVAMGLETSDPLTLDKLNKSVTLDGFRAAAEKLRREGIALRVFILVKAPFQDEDEGLYWAERSLDFAFDCGATVAAVIPTRFGNGSLEVLAQQGQFAPPRLASLEAAARYGVGLQRGRVFADLWDLSLFSDCPACFAAREARLDAMNREQRVFPTVICDACGESF